jgi:hypothetical protein
MRLTISKAVSKVETKFSSPNRLNSDDVELINGVNEALSRLRARRLPIIEIEGRYLDSRLAWKVGTYREGVLYRIVALGESLALNWNVQNMLGCCLPARALMETSALLLDFEHELRKSVAASDLDAVNDLVTNRHFATRDKKWLEAHPQAEAVNVLTLIDKLDKRLVKNARRVYDLLSERCHPNYLGHHAMFGTLDTRTGTTEYSESKDLEGNSHAIFACMALIRLVEKCIGRLETEIDRVADLQRS